MPGREKREEKKTESDPKDSSAPIFKLLTANPTLTAWLVFLGFGGALLTFYYMNIGYFPEIVWQDSFTYLAAISLLGGGVAVTYGVLVFVPGAIWSEFLIFDTALRARFCCDFPHDDEPCYWTTIIHLVAPFAIFMAVIHLARFSSSSWVEPAAVGSLVGLTVYYCLVFKALLEDITPKSEHRSRHMKAVAAVDFAALVSLTSLLILYYYVAPPAQDRAEWPLLFVCTLVVTVSNLFVAVQFRRRLARAIVTGILAGLILLFCGEILLNGASAHSKRIMERFGLGGTNTVTLLVNAEGRAIIKRLQLIPDDQDAESTSTVVSNNQKIPSTNIPPVTDSSFGTIPNAKILSRLGKEYYVAINDHTVALPKSAIISWVTDAPSRLQQPALLVSGSRQQEALQTGKPSAWRRLAIDLGATLIGLCVGLLSGRWANGRQRRSNRHLQPLASKDFCAVIPADSLLLPTISDVALAELNTRFDRLGLARKKEIHRIELVDKLPGARVVLCPSSERNDMPTTLDNLNFKLRGVESLKDYALIYWMRSTKDPRKNLFVIAGDRGDLVQAGVRYVLSRSFLSLLEARESEDLDVLVQVDLSSGTQMTMRPPIFFQACQPA